MSFRIEDILKQDPKSEHKKDIELTTNSGTKCEPNLKFQYQRSFSDPLGAYWNQSERFFPDYYETYRTRALSYPNVYMPTVWRNQSAFYPHIYYVSKRKGGQVRFTTNQTEALEKRFKSHKYLSPADRKLLADSLKLSDRQVKTWFQNRRAKWRRSSMMSSVEVTSTNKFGELTKNFELNNETAEESQE